MHSSWFSYAITKPYPFRWFTPVTIIGGVVLTVLFTILNLGSTGYYLKPTFTEDPNGTTTQALQWFMRPPLNWDRNIEPKCQPKMLAVGDRFFTTNLGFQYSIKAITKYGNDSQAKISYPSIAYMNNTLEGCYLDRVDISLRKSDTRATPSWWLSWITSSVSSTASCNIVTDLGRVNLTLGIEYIGETDHIYNYVIEDNYKTHASTWWGTRLLNAYLTGIFTTMSQIQQLGKDTYWMNGAITFRTNPTINDIRDLRAFNLQGWFLSSDGLIQGDPLTDTAVIRNDPEARFVPLIWESLHYTRILSSLIAVDLGNKNAPNLLLTKKDLQYAILPPDDPNRKAGSFLNDTLDGSNLRYSSIPSPGSHIPPSEDDLVLLNETYAKFEDQMGPLECNNATIVSQYLCSVPQSKSPGFMILAIVLANLVFLQASWTILNLIAGGFLPDTQKTVCQGCSGGQRPIELTENLPKDEKSRGTYVGVNLEEGTESQLPLNERRGSEQDKSFRNLVHGL